MEEQLVTLEILEKITFRKIEIRRKQPIIPFLIDLLLRQQLDLTNKNRAYNIAAYLASIFGKEAVMREF